MSSEMIRQRLSPYGTSISATEKVKHPAKSVIPAHSLKVPSGMGIGHMLRVCVGCVDVSDDALERGANVRNILSEKCAQIDEEVASAWPHCRGRDADTFPVVL
jgi:hypothetical protein